ncbi:hypothetical protein PR048_008565 [Dryococelus australis]|uniref:Uncharacterized protein n=1 Tax=Dryococelus australis TaxID=614101 RepID=A0ABQ9HY95_9NEOP|nr:hypothetical protein PR048_008565 [Dryococelus australis]
MRGGEWKDTGDGRADVQAVKRAVSRPEGSIRSGDCVAPPSSRSTCRRAELAGSSGQPGQRTQADDTRQLPPHHTPSKRSWHGDTFRVPLAYFLSTPRRNDSLGSTERRGVMKPDTRAAEDEMTRFTTPAISLVECDEPGRRREQPAPREMPGFPNRRVTGYLTAIENRHRLPPPTSCDRPSCILRLAGNHPNHDSIRDEQRDIIKTRHSQLPPEDGPQEGVPLPRIQTLLQAAFGIINTVIPFQEATANCPSHNLLSRTTTPVSALVKHSLDTSQGSASLAHPVRCRALVENARLKKYSVFCTGIKKTRSISVSEEVWAALNNEANEGETRLSMDSAGMKGRGEMEDPQGNPPTSDIIRHDYHMREFRSDPAANQTRFALTETKMRKECAEAQNASGESTAAAQRSGVVRFSSVATAADTVLESNAISLVCILAAVACGLPPSSCERLEESSPLQHTDLCISTSPNQSTKFINSQHTLPQPVCHVVIFRLAKKEGGLACKSWMVPFTDSFIPSTSTLSRELYTEIHLTPRHEIIIGSSGDCNFELGLRKNYPVLCKQIWLKQSCYRKVIFEGKPVIDARQNNVTDLLRNYFFSITETIVATLRALKFHPIVELFGTRFITISSSIAQVRAQLSPIYSMQLAEKGRAPEFSLPPVAPLGICYGHLSLLAPPTSGRRICNPATRHFQKQEEKGQCNPRQGRKRTMKSQDKDKKDNDIPRQGQKGQ